MTKTRKLVIDILDDSTYCAFYYGFFATIIYVTVFAAPLLWLLLFMVVIMYANYVLRCIFSSFAMLVLMHSFLPILIFVVRIYHPFSLVWIFFAIVLSAHSVIIAFRKPITEVLGFILICTGIFFALSFWNSYGVVTSLYAPLLLYIIIGRYIVLHMLKMDRTLEIIDTSQSHGQVNGSAIQKIISFNYKLVICLGLIMATATLLLQLLIMPVLSAIRNLFPNMPEIEQQLREHGTSSYERNVQPIDHNIANTADQAGLPPLIELLLNIIFHILAFAMLILIIYAIFRWILYLLSKSTGKKQKLGKSSDTTLDTREFILNRSRIKKLQTHENLHPIRAQFKETIKKHIKMGAPIKKTDTPTDMSCTIKTEDITTLTKEYSEVRYKN